LKPSKFAKQEFQSEISSVIDGSSVTSLTTPKDAVYPLKAVHSENFLKVNPQVETIEDIKGRAKSKIFESAANLVPDMKRRIRLEKKQFANTQRLVEDRRRF
jgi:hypothetical protein